MHRRIPRSPVPSRRSRRSTPATWRRSRGSSRCSVGCVPGWGSTRPPTSSGSPSASASGRPSASEGGTPTVPARGSTSRSPRLSSHPCPRQRARRRATPQHTAAPTEPPLPDRCSRVRRVETRPYRSQRRASSAAETRRIVLDAALAAYQEHGYVRATIAGIAARADVAVNTVYTSVGGKPQLLIALVESAAADAFRSAAEGDGTEAATAEEVVAGLERLVESLFIEHAWLLGEVYSNVAADPVILESIRRLEQLYEARVREAGRRLEALGCLRADVSAEDAADVLWFYLGFGRWKVLRDRGWSADRVRSWLGAQLTTALIAPKATL
ncbi:hypothetical protein DEI89_10055 [Curtobacterium sp. MCBD17_030]|nr:hypothetical protein DEI89_10055 [Curtobacterium sp. MCBD17_030]